MRPDEVGHVFSVSASGGLRHEAILIYSLRIGPAHLEQPTRPN